MPAFSLLRRQLRFGLTSLVPAGLSLAAALAPMAQARAESVVERVARSGELVLVGAPDTPPLLSLDAQGKPQGYGVEVARRIADALAVAVGRPVALRFEPLGDPGALGTRLAEGKADLACGVPFSWERDMTVDYTLPIGLSGLRLLAPVGRFDGSPAGLAHHRIAVVKESLAETELRGMQPAAVVVAVPNLAAALQALRSGQAEGVIGDSLLLAQRGGSDAARGLALTPKLPYERYAVACVVPENDSAFRNLANLAIARLLQGYVDGQPAAVAAIDRWVGPSSTIKLSQQQIRAYFETVLLGVEAIRPLPVAPASSKAP
ncbi:MAG: extracellular substrate binding-like orphan protein GrrP [Cyanobacteria bacterium]|nr:extracellular substrate binding-like orphan protein GrrP [Cyanobacteriota bacterium]